MQGRQFDILDWRIFCYLTALPFDLRLNLCKFRCGSHRLPIKSGRFFSIDRSQKESATYVTKQSYVMNFIKYLTVLSLMLKYLSFYLQMCKVKNAMSYSELMNSKARFILIGLARFLAHLVSQGEVLRSLSVRRPSSVRHSVNFLVLHATPLKPLKV